MDRLGPYYFLIRRIATPLKTDYYLLLYITVT